MLRGEALIEFYVLSGQVGSTTNGNLKLIKEGLLGSFLPINALNKQKRAMRCAMQKPQYLLLNRFSAWLTELNNYLPLTPGSSNTKKMDPEQLSKIILHAVLNSWEK